MNKVYSTVIIGGGASGLLCAVELLSNNNKLNGEEILILERNDRVGKKLIATGNGQGNLTNANITCDNYYGDKEFIDCFLGNLKNINLIEYLDNLGIPLCKSKDGKMYPISKQASAVLDIFRAFLDTHNCQIFTSEKVINVQKENNVFKIQTPNAIYMAKNVVMATGGMAQKQFGTDGESYAIAKNLGHKLTKLYPSLVQLKTEKDKIKGLKGIKESAKVSALLNGKVVHSSTGDLLFTEFGVSGSTIFQVSSAIADSQNASLKIEFLPEYSSEEIEKYIERRKNLNYFKDEDILSGIVNKKVAQSVIRQLKDKKPNAIAYALKNFTLKVTGSLGFQYAQVTRGGIETSLVDATSYQSKLVDGFYIIGEALDVDGDCGGYNLTFAFISAICCAKHIKG